MSRMYALTLRNPWAHLIAHHGKNIENRTWAPPNNIVDRLLIHAGKGNDPTPDFMQAGDWGTPSVGAIVAVAELVGACRASRWRDTVVCDCGVWARPGQYHWRLAKVFALPEPVPADGRLGLWRPEPAALDAVRAQCATWKIL